MSAPLAERLARELGVPSWSFSAQTRLDTKLADDLEIARSYWNQLPVDPETVVPYLARRLALEGEQRQDAEAVARALDALAVIDLVLCAGLAQGQARALEEFERAFGTEIEQAVRRQDASGDLGDEVRQVMRDKLFVGEPGEPLGIERYSGRGPLGRWLWVMATREGLMSRRRNKRETALEDSHLGVAVTDIELDYLKREYQDEFRKAFAEATANLQSKERNLLHYHFVRRLTIDQIGAIYRVHRVTAFRWLRLAQNALVAGTKAQMATRLHIPASEVDSVLRLVQSRFDISVERVLGMSTQQPS